MKHCGENYFPWEIKDETYLSDDERLSPNPKCIGCDYINTCVFRVAFWLEYRGDMPQKDVDTIHKLVQKGNESKKVILN